MFCDEWTICTTWQYLNSTPGPSAQHDAKERVDISAPIDKNLPVLTWLVRWSGELISKYHVGKDGNTAQERIKASTSARPATRFGESVWYLPLESAGTDQNKAEPKMYAGIWLGTIDRTEKNIIGTEHGVPECRTFRRKPKGEQWSADELSRMKGATWQPTVGYNSDQILPRESWRRKDKTGQGTSGNGGGKRRHDDSKSKERSTAAQLSDHGKGH